VTVSAEENINNGTLSALQITLNDDELEENIYYEIEGFVSQFTSSSSFELDGVSVLTSPSTTYINGAAADISNDSHLIITGSVNAQNVLFAESIKILNVEDEVLLEANIESIDLQNQTISVLGQSVRIDSFTLISDETVEDNYSIALADFLVGDSVFVSGRNVEGVFLADRLSLISAITSSYLSGTASEIDRNLSELTLFGVQVMSDSTTVYFDADFNELSKSAFFNQIVENETLLGIEGNVTGGNSLFALSMSIEAEW